MFDHPLFEKYSFQDIPLDRDLYLMDEIWADEYEQSLLKIFKGCKYIEPVGYVGCASATRLGESTVELSWYPNTYNRFHRVPVSLPREQFVMCVGSEAYDEKPHIFVKGAWLRHLYLRSYSVFALIDASDFRTLLEGGNLTREKLLRLRREIDTLAAKYQDILFISFADSLLLKSNWSVGTFEGGTKYTYEPEKFIRLISEIDCVYRDVLGVGVYAVLTQGSNEYYSDPLRHISDTGNHVCLNSLGLPFSQLSSIERAARKAVKDKKHDRMDLYMDESLFRSLNLADGFRKDARTKYDYQDPLTREKCYYYGANWREI